VIVARDEESRAVGPEWRGQGLVTRLQLEESLLPLRVVRECGLPALRPAREVERLRRAARRCPAIARQHAAGSEERRNQFHNCDHDIRRVQARSPSSQRGWTQTASAVSLVCRNPERNPALDRCSMARHTSTCARPESAAHEVTALSRGEMCAGVGAIICGCGHRRGTGVDRSQPEDLGSTAETVACVRRPCDAMRSIVFRR
jgi:hypothetical protein